MSGIKVSWETSQGKTEGKFVKTQTSDIKIKGHMVKANKSDPQVIIESSKSGKQAAHKLDAVRKT